MHPPCFPRQIPNSLRFGKRATTWQPFIWCLDCLTTFAMPNFPVGGFGRLIASSEVWVEGTQIYYKRNDTQPTLLSRPDIPDIQL